MISRISQYIGDIKFTTKILATNLVKRNVAAPDSYRKLVKEFRAKKTVFYTYQLKSESALRTVIYYLYHSLPVDEIKSALASEGFPVRNIVHIKHCRTKDPLPLVFTDLEPIEFSKSIYKLQYLLYTKV